MIFTASSEFWPKVKKIGLKLWNVFERLKLLEQLSPRIGCIYPIERAGKVRRSLTESSISWWYGVPQAGMLTTWHVAHLTGTSPFHHLLGLLLPHAALCDWLEQPGHRNKAVLDVFVAASGASTMKHQKLTAQLSPCFTYMVSVSFVVNLYSLLNFWGAVNKLMVPELKCWIFYQLNESNKETPRMRPVYNQSFQENPEIQK